MNFWRKEESSKHENLPAEILKFIDQIAKQAKSIRDDKKLVDRLLTTPNAVEKGLFSAPGRYLGNHQLAGDIKVIEPINSEITLPPNVSHETFLRVLAERIDAVLGKNVTAWQARPLQPYDHSMIDFKLDVHEVPMIRIHFRDGGQTISILFGVAGIEHGRDF